MYSSSHCFTYVVESTTYSMKEETHVWDGDMLFVVIYETNDRWVIRLFLQHTTTFYNVLPAMTFILNVILN